MKVVHAYKVYRPDVDGGIPQVIAMLTSGPGDSTTNEILVARYKGFARRYVMDGTAVTALSTLGTLFSMPLAPAYPFVLRRYAADADVLVHHAPFPLTDIGIAVGGSPKAAIVVYWHAEILGRALLRRLLSPAIRVALRRADRIIVSDEAMLSKSEFLKTHHSKCVVVPYGLDIDYWSKLSEASEAAVAALRQRYPRLIVAVGRLVGYKGLDVLLKALPATAAQLVIIGGGPLLTELRELAVHLGVADRVVFAGRITADEIKHHLHAARLLALPSVTEAEAFGLVQVEAMAAALPVINTDLPTTVPHVARHEQEGLTVPVGDFAALGQAINRLLDDPLLADRLGQAGLRRARSEFSRETYRSRVEQVYRDAVAHRQSLLEPLR